VILQTFLEEEENIPGTILKMIECVNTMVTSLTALEREEEAKEATSLLEELLATVESAFRVESS